MPSGLVRARTCPDALNLPWWFNGPGRPGGELEDRPGAVQKVEGDREFADGGGGGRDWELPGSGARRRFGLVACGWGIPEYTGSADASNNNFASSLVAGSPFAVAVEGSQLEWGTVWERPVALKVLDLAVEAGILTQADRAKLDVEMTEPSVVTPEPEKEAQTLTSLLQAKVVCLDTVRQSFGYDPQARARRKVSSRTRRTSHSRGRGRGKIPLARAAMARTTRRRAAMTAATRLIAFSASRSG